MRIIFIDIEPVQPVEKNDLAGLPGGLSELDDFDQAPAYPVGRGMSTIASILEPGTMALDLISIAPMME